MLKPLHHKGKAYFCPPLAPVQEVKIYPLYKMLLVKGPCCGCSDNQIWQRQEKCAKIFSGSSYLADLDSREILVTTITMCHTVTVLSELWRAAIIISRFNLCNRAFTWCQIKTVQLFPNLMQQRSCLHTVGESKKLTRHWRFLVSFFPLAKIS